MKLITASQFISDYFDKGSQPTLRSIKKWVKQGKLEGTFIGTRCYVDIAAFTHDVVHQIHTEAPTEEQLDIELY